MFDVNLVRNLCREIVDEDDPDKVEELLSLLQVVIKDDQEEVKLRLNYLTRKYARALAA
jgi:uncharacterized membrane protein YvbJ